MKARIKKPFNEKVPRHLRKHLAFVCPKCYSWLYHTRDLVESKMDYETGIEYRKFKCDDCKRVFEFRGRRGIHFPNITNRAKAKPRVVRPQVSEELKTLLRLHKELSRIVKGR